MGLRAVIFDFDGVVADTERLHLAGFRHALGALEIDLSEVDYFERYLGLDDRDGFAAILADNRREADESTVAGLMSSKERAFRDLVSERVRIFPGVRELLHDLRGGAEPLATAIGSGALGSEILLVLDICGLAGSFETIVAADHVTLGKPDPETFLLACERLRTRCERLEPAECLVIEDSPGGLGAAERAGMKTLAVTNSFTASQIEADLIVDSLEQVDRRRCEALFTDGTG